MIATAVKQLIGENQVFKAAYYGLVAGFTGEAFSLMLNAVIAVAAPEMFGVRSLALATGFSGILIGAFLWHLTGERASMAGPLAVTAVAGYLFNPWLPANGVTGGVLLLGALVIFGSVKSDLGGGVLFTSMTGVGMTTALYAGLATASILAGAARILNLYVQVSGGLQTWMIAVLSIGSITAVPLFSAYYAGGLEAATSGQP